LSLDNSAYGSELRLHPWVEILGELPIYGMVLVGIKITIDI